MLELIRQINIAWEQKSSLYDIEPNQQLGYFDFRNKVMLQYKKTLQKRGYYYAKSKRKFNQYNSKM